MIWKIAMWFVGAAIGLILSVTISHVSESLQLVVMAVSASVGGSITTWLGTLLFLKAEIEGQKSGGFVKALLRTMLLAIVVLAALILGGNAGLIP